MDVKERSNQKSKILVGVIHALDVGGAERMMVSILNHFVLEGFVVHLIIFDNRGALKEELNKEIMVEDLATPSVMRGMLKCLKRLKKIKPDIVFAGIGHLNIALAPFVPLMRLLLPKAKWIARETNIVSLQNQTSHSPKLFDWLYRHTYNNYDVIVAQSEDMKEDLEKNYFRSNKIVVINNPIDHEKVQQLANEKHDFVFDKSKVNLLAVSRLREEKRHDLMLKTLALLPEMYHLTLVGSGEKEEALKSLARSLKIEDRISFEGQQSNPYVYMKSADLFLLTSEREGFPNVLLEANVLGLPIVAFVCMGGIREIITPKLNGLYAPFGECRLLANKIMEAKRYYFNREEIKESTKRRFSKRVILNKYKKIFLNLY